MQVDIKSRYCNEKIELVFGHYYDGTTSISALSLEGEPVFTATVALDEVPREGCVWLKGWSENEGIPAALERIGVVKRTSRTVPTGFCHAEEAKLLIDI